MKNKKTTDKITQCEDGNPDCFHGGKAACTWCGTTENIEHPPCTKKNPCVYCYRPQESDWSPYSMKTQDGRGVIEIIVIVGKWAMVRRPRAKPFVMSLAELNDL